MQSNTKGTVLQQICSMSCNETVITIFIQQEEVGGIKKVKILTEIQLIYSQAEIFSVQELIALMNIYIGKNRREDKVYKIRFVDYTKKEVICDMRTTGNLNIPGRPQDGVK